MLLIIAGLEATAMLVSVYWESQEWTWRISNDCWERGNGWSIFGPCIIGVWMIGLVACGAPAIALPALAICGP